MKNTLKIVVLFAATLVAGCSDPEAEANKLFTEASQLVREAIQIKDGNSSLAYIKLKAATELLDNIPAKYPSSSLSVKISEGDLKIQGQSIAEINQLRNNPNYWILLASSDGDIQFAELLLTKGADLNFRDVNGWTPIFHAVQGAHKEFVKWLVKNGADINTSNMQNYSLRKKPLDLAFEKGLSEIASYLIENGGSGNSIGIIRKRDINYSVTVSGEINPAKTVNVRAKISGEIAELPVDLSDRVSEGELLVRLDDKAIRHELESRKKQIDSAKLQLEQYKSEYERSKKLFDDSLIAEEVFQNIKTKYEAARILRDRAQNNFDLSKEKLSKTSILAPFDCTVLSRPVSISQAVSGGTEVMKIADLKTLIILSHVNQADVSRMRKNQKVQIEIEAVADLFVDGIVEGIAPQATIRSGIKGFSTRIKLLNTAPSIIPGMTATIILPVANSKDVAAAPLASIFTERNDVEQRTKTYAYVKTEGKKYAKQMIDVGVNDLNYVEITKGLKIGDIVSLVKPDSDLITETKN